MTIEEQYLLDLEIELMYIKLREIQEKENKNKLLLKQYTITGKDIISL